MKSERKPLSRNDSRHADNFSYVNLSIEGAPLSARRLRTPSRDDVSLLPVRRRRRGDELEVPSPRSVEIDDARAGTWSGCHQMRGSDDLPAVPPADIDRGVEVVDRQRDVGRSTLCRAGGLPCVNGRVVLQQFDAVWAEGHCRRADCGTPDASGAPRDRLVEGERPFENEAKAVAPHAQCVVQIGDGQARVGDVCNERGNTHPVSIVRTGRRRRQTSSWWSSTGTVGPPTGIAMPARCARPAVRAIDPAG